MRSVGIKQLKARLSEYVRLAREGQIILVTDRDEVVAEIGPARRGPAEPGSLDAVLDRLAQRGQVTRASEPKKGWAWSPPHLGMSVDAAGRLLDELREER